jgi:hypothetical protein
MVSEIVQSGNRQQEAADLIEGFIKEALAEDVSADDLLNACC